MSATPMRAQTVLTSGKWLSSSRSTSFSRSMVSDSELPGRRNVCMAMSPSSSSGMNSPPILAKTVAVTTSSSRLTTATSLLFLRANVSTG